ncbi:MAG: thioredoxin domain-containing protein [Blastocatellia bacterium]|nr:thioredoxin domain-containing protein [Blastocatellia bacterium]
MTAHSNPKFTNRLAGETSPYLLQHAHNPVDWFPWGEEAIAAARATDKPILLSIGYSACHWCHVMERESFENETTAELMNKLFVNIKVDREERPDIDSIYMQSVQMMTGHGGWPLTVFLRPDGAPFFGGTYFPPEDRHGMTGFPTLLERISEIYRTRRDDIDTQATAMVESLRASTRMPPREGDLTFGVLDEAFRATTRTFDPKDGGFGRAPKFPAAMLMDFLLRYHARTERPDALHMVEHSLEKMAFGGIYDQIGGGFARYATDDRWLVPHFEKMLYDNAQLARVYTDAFRLTGKPLYRRIVEETLDYVVREMTAEVGAFYSAQDADSEGVEGKFYVWTVDEVTAVLGDEDGRLFCSYFDVTKGGNWEHTNILNVPRDIDSVARIEGVTVERLQQAIDRGRPELYAVRSKRVWPGLDDKTLTAWNGLMLRAFAEAGVALDRDDYLDVARRNADFILTHLRRDGLLLRTYKNGESKLNGYLEDYAYTIEGLVSLYEATFELRWLREAKSLAETMIAEFWDETEGGFFFTGNAHEELIRRTKELEDNATPSGNSSAAWGLLRLSALLGNLEYRDRAETVLEAVGGALGRYARAFGHALCALDAMVSTSIEVAIVGDPADEAARALAREARRRYVPGMVVAGASPDDSESAAMIPVLHDRGLVDGKPAAYVCQDRTCGLPVTTVEALAEQLAAI